MASRDGPAVPGARHGLRPAGVCGTTNADLVRSIGADHVIDYTRDDFADGVQLYDLILDTAGHRSLFSKEPKEDLQFLKELIEAGKVTLVIDRTYPMSEVPEAIRHLGNGHGRGKTVITVAAVD